MNSLEANERSGSSRITIACADTSLLPRAAAIRTPASMNVIVIRFSARHLRGDRRAHVRFPPRTRAALPTQRSARGSAATARPGESEAFLAGRPRCPEYFSKVRPLIVLLSGAVSILSVLKLGMKRFLFERLRAFL